MRKFFALRFAVIIAIGCTFTACADYLSDNNNETANGNIGLPGGVNVLNTELSYAKSRGINELTSPKIHTRSAVGGNNPLFVRYTATPGIQIRKTNSLAEVPTRGTAITTNSFYDSYSLYNYVYSNTTTWAATASTSGFTYSRTYFDEEVKLSKGWGTNEFWPGDKKKCAFFAYAPYHAVGLSNFNSNGWPSFHYSVPLDAIQENDLLVTKNDISTGTSDYGNIDVPGNFNKPDSITFDHACTAVRFAIGNQMAPGIIKKIRICNVYGAGNYNYQTESWSNVDSLKTFTLTQDFEIRAGEQNKLLNNEDNIFMMIPQTVPIDATMEVTIDDGSLHTITAFLDNDKWEKGYTVTYYLSTQKVDNSYVLSIAPASGNIACTGGTKAVTINSYKQTYYGTQIAVPWTASYNYSDPNEGTSATYNTSTGVVPGFVVSGNGSTTGESVNFQVASQVARSRSWRSSHTQTLRNAADASGNLAAGKRTANCYVVQAPGTYTFPLVYGNSLNADGSSNDDSYKTPTFVDHNGVQIDSPYIYMTNGSANVPYDACIVWQDAPHLVTPSSVQLTSDKHSIQFTVERKNICAGNCVIAVRDKNQNIMWSWHIWVTDHNISNTIAVTNPYGKTSNFMNVPVGWCDPELRVYDKRTFHLNVQQSETGGQTASADIIQLSNDSTYEYGANVPYYQWGRKDPFLPGNGMGGNKPYYDNQYIPLQLMNSTAVKDNILNPNKFNTNSSRSSLELWNKGNSITTVNNNTVNKTIYSTAPSNYVEPNSAAYTGFTNSNISSTYNYGIYYFANPNATGNTIYFYTSGYRDGTTLSHWHDYGHWWTAGPVNSNQAITFFIHSSNTDSVQNVDVTSYGFDIFCVLE